MVSERTSYLGHVPGLTAAEMCIFARWVSARPDPRHFAVGQLDAEAVA